MAFIRDRWYFTNPASGRRKKTDRYGKGLRWQVEYTNGDGDVRRKSFAYRELADAFCTEVKAEQHRGVYRRGTGRETFQDVAKQWLDAQIHLRDTSRNAARIRLEKTVYPSLGSRPITLISQADVQAAVAAWALDYAPSTVRLAYGYMSSVFHYAVARELIPRSPCVKIRLPRESTDKIVPLADETVARVAAAVPAHLEAMVWLIAATGLRGGEARALTWDRVHETHLVVDRQIVALDAGHPMWGPTKTESSRRKITIGPMVHAMLTKHREMFGEGAGETVFRSATGQPVMRSTMSRAWRTARSKAPLAGAGWHQLRHYHASKLIAAGLSPVAVAHRLGHKDATETLQTYAHLWPSEDAVMAAQGDEIVAPVMGGNVRALRTS